MQTTMIRLPKVLATTGLGRSSLYAAVKDGLFVKPVPLGPRAVGFAEHEVQAINQAKLSGKSLTEIRELVATLHAQRTEGVPA